MEESSRTAAAARLTARAPKTKFKIVANAAALMRVRGFDGTTLDDVVSRSRQAGFPVVQWQSQRSGTESALARFA
ncbi:hypothetical protein GCM10023322_32880 [Rugosimonospora acidiphila]|uniref:Uncharacterized protein n=1 Tax=Rugosimonospora acidiphila TaxID=556531 RepID=A0ABP9RU23_9ACTN